MFNSHSSLVLCWLYFIESLCPSCVLFLKHFLTGFDLSRGYSAIRTKVSIVQTTVAAWTIDDYLHVIII